MTTIKDLRKLKAKALTGNEQAKRELYTLSNSLKVQVNKETRLMERGGADYGNAYNRIKNFADIEYGKGRLLSNKELNFDVEAIAKQSEEAITFLNSPYSSLKAVREMERSRKETFINAGIFEVDISDKKARSFLKFLGNEESQQLLDQWTSSDDVVEMLYDAYNKKTNSRRKMIEVFDEYLSGNSNMSFNQMMERLGVDVLKYPKSDLSYLWDR